MVRRKVKGEIFVIGFALFSLSSYFLSYYLSRTTEFIFIFGAIFLLSSELSIRGRKKIEKIIVFLVLFVIGIYLLFISATQFIAVIESSTLQYTLGLMYIIGWILMISSSGVLKLSKII